jgi:hypothetical protein
MTVQRQRPYALQRGEQAPPLLKIAHNSATESENKIHDDAEAQRLGLRGGLVPGVTLYAYLTELLLPLIGPDFLRRGSSLVRFIRPVYEQEQVTCTATLTSTTSDPAAGPVSFDLAVIGPDGAACAIGSAALDLFAPAPSREPAGAPAPVVDPANRPALTRESAPIGAPLATRTVRVDAETVEAYADEVADPSPWYRGGSPFGLPLVPPGLLAGQPARLLRQNFSFGPSVHTASEIQHLALPLAGGDYTVDAKLVETFTKRGNEYLVAAVWLRDHQARPVMRIRHTSIFSFAARA